MGKSSVVLGQPVHIAMFAGPGSWPIFGSPSNQLMFRLIFLALNLHICTIQNPSIFGVVIHLSRRREPSLLQQHHKAKPQEFEQAVIRRRSDWRFFYNKNFERMGILEASITGRSHMISPFQYDFKGCFRSENGAQTPQFLECQNMMVDIDKSWDVGQHCTFRPMTEATSL